MFQNEGFELNHILFECHKQANYQATVNYYLGVACAGSRAYSRVPYNDKRIFKGKFLRSRKADSSNLMECDVSSFFNS